MLIFNTKNSTKKITVLIVLFIACLFWKNTVYAAQGRITAANVNIRSKPTTNSSKIMSLSKNTLVDIIGQQNGTDGYLWYGISTNNLIGYIRSDLITTETTVSTTPDFETQIAGFPESYKNGLRELHTLYPNWIFKPVQTGLDWEYALNEEMKGTLSLVYKNSISSWKSTETGKFNWLTSSWPGFDGAIWVAASREITAYYMDPRNWLLDNYIFQFESQKYNSATQNETGLSQMVKGTYLEKSVQTSDTFATDTNNGATSSSPEQSSETQPSSGQQYATGYNNEYFINYYQPGSTTAQSETADTANMQIVPMTSQVQPIQNSLSSNIIPYSKIIMSAAIKSGVSPYALASILLQEQGTNGIGRCISGTVSGYYGIYNYFNIGAYAANGMGAVERGLWWASQSGSYNRPWNSIDKAIINGALWYANSYINAGQDTLYLKKWNVLGKNKFQHQYMTNVEGAAEEGKKLASAYTKDIKNQIHEFDIPIFNNMPTSNCPKPTGDGNPNNKLQSLAIQGFHFNETFNMDTEAYTLSVDNSVTSLTVSANAIHNKATVSGTGTIQLTETVTTIPVMVTAENGAQRLYTITVLKQDGGQLATMTYGMNSGIATAITPSGTMQPSVIDISQNITN